MEQNDQVLIMKAPAHWGGSWAAEICSWQKPLVTDQCIRDMGLHESFI